MNESSLYIETSFLNEGACWTQWRIYLWNKKETHFNRIIVNAPGIPIQAVMFWRTLTFILCLATLILGIVDHQLLWFGYFNQWVTILCTLVMALLIINHHLMKRRFKVFAIEPFGHKFEVATRDYTFWKYIVILYEVAFSMSFIALVAFWTFIYTDYESPEEGGHNLT